MVATKPNIYGGAARVKSELIAMLFTVLCLSLGAAVLIDRYVAEFHRFHPLVGFGNLALALERQYNHSESSTAYLRGARSVALLVVLPTLTCLVVQYILWTTHPILFLLFATAVLYFCIGLRSLEQHATAIAVPLFAGDITQARAALQYIVSRDTSELTERQIANACVESVLENSSDAVYCALFWFACLGPAGAIMWRAANTLDAMWGYKTPRYRYFGFAAAKLDDALAWVPARITALLFSLQGNVHAALACWRQQAPKCKSPNGGPVMCTGAASLKLVLGGRVNYHGTTQYNPAMGCGEIRYQRNVIRRATAADIARAVTLVKQTNYWWLLISALLGAACWPALLAG